MRRIGHVNLLKNFVDNDEEDFKSEVPASVTFHQDGSIIGPPSGHHRATIRPVSDYPQTTIGLVSDNHWSGPRLLSGHGEAIMGPVLDHHQATMEPPSDHDKGNIESISLPKKQLEIYDWFIGNGVKGRFNKVLIQNELGAAYKTIQKTILKLTNTGILRIKYDASLKEFDYELNTQIKIKRPGFKKGHHQAAMGPPPGHNKASIRKSNDAAIGTLSDRHQTTALISSSLLYNKTTTTENHTPNHPMDEAVIEKNLDHPELEFWRGQGTTAKQILNGVQTTGTTLENFIQSMKHYAHEEPASEKAPMAHLIGGIKKNGIWAKKPDYKSHEQKQIEIQKQIIAERNKELEQLREIRKAVAKVMADLEFEKFMADRDAELYQEIFQSLTDFEKKRVALGKDDAMRRAWEKKSGI